MLDAYAIRKAVPRILVAAIGINLSIYLCVAAIDITKVLGHGIGELLTYPFLNNDAWHRVAVENNGANISTGIFFVLGLFATGATAIFAPAVIGGAILFALPMIAAFVISAALIMLAILFTLAIRQALLIFCVVISPIAIALFVLPGTEKYFKKWVDLFVSTLMVYPIISVLFAMSTVMTTVLLGTANLSPSAIGLTKILSAVVVAFAPLIMIPFAFKLAGGAISAVMNAGVGKSRTLAGSARKGLEDMKRNPNTLYGKAVRKNFGNRLDKGLTAGQIGSGLMATSRGRSYKNAAGAYRTEKSMLRMDELDKLDAMQPIKGNDDFLNALRLFKSEADTRSYLASVINPDTGGLAYQGASLDTAVASVMRARSLGSHSELAQYAAVQNVATGTAYAGGQGEMLQAINMAAGGDRVLAANMLVRARSLAPQARRPDLAGGGFGDNLDQLEQLHQAGNTDAEAAKVTAHMDAASLDANGGAQFAYARKSVIKRLAPAMTDRVVSAIGSGSERSIMQALASTSGIHDSLSAVSPEAAREMADGVMAQSVDLSSLPPDIRDIVATQPDGTRSTARSMTIHEIIENHRNNPLFQEMRREHQSMSQAVAASMMTAGGPGGTAPGAPTNTPPLPPG